MMVNRAMNIIVTNYNDNWVQLFKTEAKKICELFKDEMIDIHHIGSTAVPGLKAKPIIDIMPLAFL
ncbi:hypothetical protein WQ54_03540 [Bacillus sp. SA1-12]|uniref:GrpB family protein n=1 Tax=Bacillus sp. SA1-12 TaxID=1455638 RepID=UPI00062585E8|nr:GrpB family protein [Bacillus sp. SA1-12]KKI93322.1 hypothetical protein WQ54_03540 [Bacillus sp. SA1-12]